MKSKKPIMSMVVILTALICAGPALSDDNSGTDVRAKLEALIEEYVDCCNAKSALLGSRSENIRKSATISCMKASYTHHNKEALIQELLDRNIEPKAYKVRHFLSVKFNENSLATILAGK